MEMVVDKRNTMSFFVHGLGHLSAKKSKVVVLIRTMEIGQLITHVQELRRKN